MPTVGNERITEDFVRDHFKNDPLFSAIKLDEQKTSVAKAKICLAKASKKLTGKGGSPEFIISFPALPDDIIVVECKADAKFHKSADGNTPTGYAVDGALHYSSFLSQEYNVISIAVSGDATDLNQIDGANAAQSATKTPQITSTDWRGFRYDALFEIKKGHRLTKSHMKEGGTPFIGAIDSNNGHRQYVSVSPDHPGNTITVNYNGNGVAEAFYQYVPFFASDDVNVLYPRFVLNPYIAMFLCVIIRQEKFRFSYGRKWHLERMNEAIMRLPVTSANKPDWKFMERYIKSLPYSKSI